MHGGVKFYRGAACAARAYVERDRSRADDYYLGKGTGVATRLTAGPAGPVMNVGSMPGETYEQWVAGFDIATGRTKGRVREDTNALRFIEVVVNGPKTWSLAAALHPEISDALDAAQDKAATEIVGWIAGHATTRVGPRGRQVQVPVRSIEAAVIRHFTSRAGDPHRHLHLQINARVWAADAWRGIHSVGIRDSVEAINGIGHAAVVTDPQFRCALAAHRLTLDPETSEIRELAPYVGAFSARTAQIRRNVDRYEAAWRGDHSGEEPGPRLREAWDRRAWAQARPDKVIPTDGRELVDRWNAELCELGYRDPSAPVQVKGTRPGWIDRNAAADLIVSILGTKKSAWSLAARSVAFAGKPMSQVRHSDVETWVKQMDAAGLAPGTIKTRYVNVRSVFRAAVKDRVIGVDPTDAVCLPRRRRADQAMSISTPEQVGQLMAVADERFQPFNALCAFARLRLGEAAAVQLRDVDFLRKTLKISRQVQRVNGGAIDVRAPKYGSERVVYLGNSLINMLAEHIAAHGSNGDAGWLFAGEATIRRTKTPWATGGATLCVMPACLASSFTTYGTFTRPVSSRLGATS